MNCAKCKKKGVVKRVDKVFCKRCFTSIIDRAVRKRVRQYDLKKGQTVFVFGEISKYFLENVINLPLNVVMKGNKRVVELAKTSGKLDVLQWTMDDECMVFLDSMFNGKVLKKGKDFIKIFYSLEVRDLNNYIKLNKLKIKKIERKGELYRILDKLENKYPGTKTSLLKSTEKVKA